MTESKRTITIENAKDFTAKELATFTPEELVELQTILEEIQSFDRSEAAADSVENASDVSTHPVMFTICRDLSNHIETSLPELYKDTRGEKSAIAAFELLGDKKVSVLVSNILLQSAAKGASRQKVIDSITETIQYSLLDHVIATSDDKQMKGYVKDLNSANLSVSQYKETLRHIADNNEHLNFHNSTPIRKVVQKIVQCATSYNNLFEAVDVPKKDNKTRQFKSIQSFQFTGSAIKRFKGLSKELAERRSTYLPMVCPPKPWVSTQEGGFMSDYVKIDLVKVKGTYAEKRYYNNKVDKMMEANPAWVRGVNALQSTAYVVNKKILALASKIEKAKGGMLGMASTTPLKNKKDEIEREGKRRANETTLKLARLYKKYPAIYNVYTCDFRGRVYAASTFSSQSDDITKSMLQFAEGKKLGKTGYRELVITTATHYGVDGLDKQSRNFKYEWAHSEEGRKIIRAAATCDLNNPEFKKYVIDAKVEAPFLFVQCALELAKIIDATDKKRQNFKSHVAAAYDGTASACQHASAGLKSYSLAESVNVTTSTDDDPLADLYSDVATAMVKILEDHTPEEIAHLSAAKGKDDRSIDACRSIKEAFLSADYSTRRMCAKKSVMCIGYGQQAQGRRDNLIDVFKKGEIKVECTPYEFGSILGWALELALDEAAAVAKTMNEFYSKSIRAMGEKPVEIVSPAGFLMMQNYHKTEDEHVITGLNKKQLRIQFKKMSDDININKQCAAASPNATHQNDGAHCLRTADRAVSEGMSIICVHDDFAVHCADGQRLGVILREEFVDMYKVSPLESYRQQLIEQGGKDEELPQIPYAPEDDRLNIEECLDSVNFFA